MAKRKGSFQLPFSPIRVIAGVKLMDHLDVKKLILDKFQQEASYISPRANITKPARIFIWQDEV